MTSKAVIPHPRPAYGWVIFAISVLFVFFKYVLEVSPSIMTKQLMSEFKIDAAMVGHVAASYYYAYTIMQIPGGLLIDAFGPRRTTTLGVLACSFGALLFAFSESIFLISLSRFLMGIGATFAILNTFKINSSWFPAKRFALLAGLTLTLGTLGAVFGQAPLSHLIQFLGWRQSFVDLAIFGFIFSGIFYLFVRDKPNHPAYDVTPPTRGKVKLSDALRHTIRRGQTWILSIYSGLSFAPVLSFAGLWGVSFIEVKYHIDRTTASFLTSLVFIGFAIGAPLFGWFSTYIGKRKPFMFLGTSLSLVLMTFAIYSPPLHFIFFAVILFLIGFFISAFLLSFSVIHEINVPLMTATAIGIMNTVNGLFGALSDPLIGIFLDLSRSGSFFSVTDYYFALAILPTYLLVCLFLLFFTKETHCIQTLEDKP